MDNEKRFSFEGGGTSTEEEFSGETASRARNRTVMLTPEITGQVRARLAQELDPAQVPARGPADDGFESPLARGGGGYGTAEPRRRAEPARTESYVPPPVAAPAPAAQQSGIVWSRESPIVGFLVSFDEDQNGEFFVLRSGRVMVTSADGGGDNALILADPSVSPMHAIMRITAGGEIQILDQLSEFGTRIRRFGSEEEEQLSGEKSSLEHGDVVKFGSRSFTVCIVARNS